MCPHLLRLRLLSVPMLRHGQAHTELSERGLGLFLGQLERMDRFRRWSTLHLHRGIVSEGLTVALITLRVLFIQTQINKAIRCPLSGTLSAVKVFLLFDPSHTNKKGLESIDGRTQEAAACLLVKSDLRLRRERPGTH